MNRQVARRSSAAPVSRAAAREFDLIQERGMLQRARIEVEEQNAAYQADMRIRNTYELADHLVYRAAQLNHQIAAVSNGNPGLEMLLRAVVEQPVAMDAAGVIHDCARRF